MENKIVITSFTSMTTAEGENISYTFSEIDPSGKKVVENERRTFVAMDENIVISLLNIKKYIKQVHTK